MPKKNQDTRNKNQRNIKLQKTNKIQKVSLEGGKAG
jgi:hypothetical protein